MSEEEKKAINNLRKYIDEDVVYKNKKAESDFEEYCINHCRDIETVLNLIKSQQEKIEKNKRLFSIQEKRKLQLLQRKDKEIEKKDKIIDLILEEIAFDYEINSSEDVVTIKRQLKEKFEKKVEGKQC